MQKFWLVLDGKATAYSLPYFSYSNTLSLILRQYEIFNNHLAIDFCEL